VEQPAGHGRNAATHNLHVPVLLVRDLGSEERLVFRVIECRDRSDAVTSLASELGGSDRVEFNQANIKDLVVEGIGELPGIFEPPTLAQLEQADD